MDPRGVGWFWRERPWSEFANTKLSKVENKPQDTFNRPETWQGVFRDGIALVCTRGWPGGEV